MTRLLELPDDREDVRRPRPGPTVSAFALFTLTFCPRNRSCSSPKPFTDSMNMSRARSMAPRLDCVVDAKH